ncbi:MAG: hypothetical protein JWQ30_2170 [Sediminibacterium sp.]|nr:hypothetical protein [Sediminibacterium sp.]
MCCASTYAQDSLVASRPVFMSGELKQVSDSISYDNNQYLYKRKPNKSRIYLAAAGSVAWYTGSLVALSNAWYTNYPQSSFHFFNDNIDWLQVDKAGHIFSAYTAGKWSMELWRWPGLSRKQRIWIGGLSGTAFLTVVEVLDGFSSGWGFSIGDLGADFAGSSLFIAQELAWKEQRVQVKFSFHRKTYSDPALNQRADDLFGHRTLERMLKDYNGQTYWLSANLKSFFKRSNFPPWLNIAVGYGADGMFGGTENIVKDKNGLVVFNRSDVPRYRQWYLAPDIDLTKIKTKSKFLRSAFFLLNSLKFPAPSIGFSKKGIEWNWLHF